MPVLSCLLRWSTPTVAAAMVLMGSGCGGASTNFGNGGGSGPDATAGGTACVPGQQSACACAGAALAGVQTCNQDGHGFGPCTGCPGGPTGNDSGGGGGDDGGGAQGDAGATGNDAAGGPGGDGGGGGPKGPACDVPEAGAPCDPGNVLCLGAGMSCPVASSFCCENLAGSTGSCNGSTSACTQSDSLHCDETADCDGGVCCMAVNVGFLTTVTSSCKAVCPTGEFQLCHSNTECSGGKCIPQSCLSGGSTEACTMVTGCTAK